MPPIAQIGNYQLFAVQPLSLIRLGNARYGERPLNRQASRKEEAAAGPEQKAKEEEKKTVQRTLPNKADELYTAEIRPKVQRGLHLLAA